MVVKGSREWFIVEIIDLGFKIDVAYESKDSFKFVWKEQVTPFEVGKRLEVLVTKYNNTQFLYWDELLDNVKVKMQEKQKK